MDICSICNDNKVIEGFPFLRYTVYICSKCGFRWLHPQPTDAELAEIYSDQYFLGEGEVEITNIVNKMKRATASLYLEQLINGDSSSTSESSS